MKFKNVLLVFSLMLCILFSVSCVAASDVNDTAVASDINDTVVASDVNDVEIAGSDENQVIGQANDDLIEKTKKGNFVELQNKIIQAQEGATIKLDKDYSYDASSKTNFGILIYKNITIDGRGHTIDGMSKSGIFTILYSLKSNNKVILKNIVFKNGFTNLYGGAILNFAKLTVDNCTFINNHANTAGGAIVSLGSLNLKNSRFIKNSAGGGAGAVFSLNLQANSNFYKSLNLSIYDPEKLAPVIANVIKNTANITPIIRSLIKDVKDITPLIATLIQSSNDLTSIVKALINNTDDLTPILSHLIKNNALTPIIENLINNTQDLNPIIEKIIKSAELIPILTVLIKNSKDLLPVINLLIKNTKDITPILASLIKSAEDLTPVIVGLIKNTKDLTPIISTLIKDSENGLKAIASLMNADDLISIFTTFTSGTLKEGKDYISHCTFTNNVAKGNGGAVYAFSSISISNSKFNSNKATGKGGAVFGNKNLYIQNSKFNKNKASQYGGAVYFKCHEQSGHYKNGKWVSSIKFYSNLIKNSVFANNVAGERGGAIYGFKASQADKVHCAKAVKCTFSDNKAPKGKDIYGGTISKSVFKNTRIALKTVTVKKSAKSLVLTAILKKGSSPLKAKQVIFKFNGKNYKAKTNAKGIAKYVVQKNVLKMLKVGKKIAYAARYSSFTAKKTAVVKR